MRDYQLPQRVYIACVCVSVCLFVCVCRAVSPHNYTQLSRLNEIINYPHTRSPAFHLIVSKYFPDERNSRSHWLIHVSADFAGNLPMV